VTLPVTGQTTVAGIIGDPVAHSRSPAIHNAAYAALGLDWTYVAFRVAPGTVGAALAGLRTLHVAGCNVTMPHKREAAEACDELAVTAAALGVVNTVVVRDGRLVGDSTDGAGFVDAAREAGVALTGVALLVLGAGGAARAIVHAVAGPTARLRVAARRPDAAAAVAALAPGTAPVPFDELDDAVAASDVVVNATPLGMHGEAPPFATDRLTPHHVVFDTVYAPSETPLLAAARARGAQAVNGLGMLVHQAARSFVLITGRDAPLEIMWAAARDDR
jgi:shikimate dehydrogenase